MRGLRRRLVRVARAGRHAPPTRRLVCRAGRRQRGPRGASARPAAWPAPSVGPGRSLWPAH
eukprot:7759683-Pyramimonas_sp.AAC.1